jgi:hypothetical protein
VNNAVTIQPGKPLTVYKAETPIQTPHLARMRPKRERGIALALPEPVEHREVGPHVVGPVGVGRVERVLPLLGGLHVLGRPPLRLALVIHHVDTSDLQSSICQS